jgi:phosphomannomutase
MIQFVIVEVKVLWFYRFSEYFDLIRCSFFWHYLPTEKPLEGFHIVVDAGNGAGGFFAVSCH